MQELNNTVAFIDSGHGGLDILYYYMLARQKRFPASSKDPCGKENLVYVADLKFMPYGKLQKSDIYQWCLEVFKRIEKKFRPDLFVVACNTATAHAIDQLRLDFDRPIVGMEPYLNYINKIPETKILKKGEIGALVTPATVASSRFKRLKKEKDPEGLIEVMAPTELATLIENYVFSKNREVLIEGLQRLFDRYLPVNWKYVILGCTHYPLVKNEIEKVIGAKCISPAPYVVDQILRKLNLDTPIEIKTDHLEEIIKNFSFHYLNTCEENWRIATLNEFLPWYLIS